MSFVCLIDGAKFEDKKSLHSYISRRLKIKLADYCHKYIPRYDKWDGRLINYKNEDFYFNSLFNTRENLVNYIQKNPNDLETVKKVLEGRKKMKGLKFAPSTMESRTSILPSPMLLEKYKIDYNLISREVGLEPRYEYSGALTFDSKPLDILIDSREQNPLKFKCETVQTTLNYGDYTSKSHYKKVFIERKSLTDLIGTMSKGFERFCREQTRAADNYLIVLVEEPLNTIIKSHSTPLIKQSRVTGDFLGTRIREVAQQFGGTTQFLFVNGREESSRVVERIFRVEQDVRKLDCQYLYDRKLL